MKHRLTGCVLLFVLLQPYVKALTGTTFKRLCLSKTLLLNTPATDSDKSVTILQSEYYHVLNDEISDTNSPDNEFLNEKKRSKLKFGGKMRYKSKSFPIPHDLDQLDYFFNMKDTERVILSGGRNDSEIEYLNSDNLIPDLNYFTRWEKEAKMFGGEAPSVHDSLVRIIPSSIKILSVEVYPKSVIGTKFLRNNSLPEFQAVLIDDKPTAKGPKALVHLFNLIVNAKKNSSESAFLRLWVHLEDDDTATFVAESEMYLEFSFPSLLLKLFPIDKQKAERICSSAVLNALKVNLIPAIDCLYDRYLEFFHTTEQSR